MAITDTLSNIKDFFFSWHKERYADIHTKETNKVDNDLTKRDYLTTNGAVYDALTQQASSFQSTLDDYNNRINAINSRVDSVGDNIKVAKSWSNYPNVLEEYDTYWDDDTRGFNWPDLDSDAHNGFITPKEKANLYYSTKWYEITGKAIGGETGVTKHMTMWVNLGLRLVYFNFTYKNCPWLKREYANDKSKYWFSYPYSTNNEVFYQVRPIKSIYAPTSYHNVYMSVRSNGQFFLYSTEPITKNIDIVGSLMWFYRDSAVSNKIGTYEEY